MRHSAILSSALALLTLLPGCAARQGDALMPASASSAGLAPVAVDLRKRDTAETPYGSLNAVTVPAGHVIGDGMFPYEGIGWENGYVGYRLYLDGRLTSDVFGKRQSAPVLSKVSAASKYHDLADWGMDVLHVGPSLGMGGLGILRNGEPRQFGEIASINATIDSAGPETGRFTIRARGIKHAEGSSGHITSRYSLGRASPMTRVSVTSEGGLPLVAGIVRNDGTEFWQSSGKPTDRWRYIATFGKQSENKDNLGIALFYRADQARYGDLANATHFVAFNGPAFEYGFLAAWEQDANAVKTKADFEALLERELVRLEMSPQGTRK